MVDTMKVLKYLAKTELLRHFNLLKSHFNKVNIPLAIFSEYKFVSESIRKDGNSKIFALLACIFLSPVINEIAILFLGKFSVNWVSANIKFNDLQCIAIFGSKEKNAFIIPSLSHVVELEYGANVLKSRFLTCVDPIFFITLGYGGGG